MKKNDIKLSKYFIICIIFISLQPVFSKNIYKSIKTRELNIQYYKILKLKALKKYDQAILECKKFIKKKPSYIKIYSLIAQVSKKKDKLLKTIEFLKDIQSNDKDNPYLYYGLSVCYKNLKDMSMSKALIKKTIELNAKFRPLYNDLVNSATKRIDQNKLIEYLKKKIISKPDNNFLYNALGRLYFYKLKDHKMGLKFYLQALAAAQRSADQDFEAQELSALGKYYARRSNFTKALSYYNKAINAAKLSQNKNAEANYYKDCAINYNQLSNFSMSIKYSDQCLKLARDIYDKELEARILLSTGYIYFIKTDLDKALNYLNKAFRIANDYGIMGLAGVCQRAKGSIYLYRENYPKAIDAYKKSLEIVRINGDKYNEGSCLWEIGTVYRKTGKYSKALLYYQKALKVAKDNNIKRITANTLICIGMIQHIMGEHSKELRLYQQALKMQKEMGVKTNIATSLHNIASVYLNQKKYSKALEYYKESYTISKELKHKRNELNCLVAIANVHKDKGDLSKALQMYKELKKKANKEGLLESDMLISYDIGLVYYKQKKYMASIRLFNEALVIARKLGRPQEIWESLSGLASVYREQAKYPEALSLFKRSINTIEDTRDKFRSGENKTGFFKNHIKIYESAVDLLYKLHLNDPSKNYHEEALYFVEKAKARAFLDRLQEAKIDLGKNMSAEIRERERRISKEISRVQTALIKTGSTDSKRKVLLDKLDKLDEDYRYLTIQIKKENPEFAKIVFPKPYKLDEIRKNLLTEDSAIIEYFISENDIFLYYITNYDYSIYKLKNSPAILERTENYLDILSDSREDQYIADKAGHKLYKELFNPIKDKIIKIKKLIIIPDRILHYLPFETLIVSTDKNDQKSKYLINNHQISYAPSASSLANLILRKNNTVSKLDLLAFADPVYINKNSSGTKLNTDKITKELYLKERFNFNNLKYSNEEVRSITRLIKKNFSNVYVREKAIEDTLKKLTLKDYKILHFATHGLLDENVAGHSGLILTLDDDPQEDGFLQVWEIYNMQLNADLVVLSACQTGRGKLEAGEGVTGLSRAFLHAGAKSVLVSLWNINDKATSIFMKYFYNFLIQGKNKTESLRLAKIEMLNSKYSQPYYWGAFILIGDHNSKIRFTK